MPGGGSLLAAVAAAGGVEPEVAGKPYRPMADAVRARIGDAAGDGWLVGDRPDTDGLMARVRHVRRQGWCLVNQELEEGLVSLAAPIVDAGGQVIAALNISGQANRTPPRQMQERVRSAKDLERYINPTEDERQAIEALAERFRFVITPYYASLMDPDDPACPIRKQVVPRTVELDDPAGTADPLDEVAHSPVKNVIRVYPDRIAFCVNNECALYCRFCLRKRMVGDEEWIMKKRELEVGLDWIRRTPAIRDVLLTGGDPLVFSDDKLEWLVAELRRIPHVEIVRLGTRLPVTLPFRVTDALCRMLERYHPIWVNTHFNHAKELTPEAAQACDRLLRAGIPVGKFTVFAGALGVVLLVVSLALVVAYNHILGRLTGQRDLA